MLEKTRLNMNTNFVEGFNRSKRRSLPSNVTFQGNITGRAYSSANSVKFGPGESVLKLCTTLYCEAPVGGSAYMALRYTKSGHFTKTALILFEEDSTEVKCHFFQGNITGRLIHKTVLILILENQKLWTLYCEAPVYGSKKTKSGHFTKTAQKYYIIQAI
ncbi:unnamed protein product [Mytilus coruscus]|uniref:Uncharacterized protein n=1 Tax=Mytilus coruscus TaxID=42192 RepID=A0A6J8ETB1_MYTCO|nr:unnamed protein product [Mytilus coruscus]